MYHLIILLASISFTTWQPDFETAKKVAKEKNQLILLNFSGSDWCGPCIRFKKEIFETEVFGKMADENLVLLNADFPRNKKNQLNKEKQAHNDALAEKYNPMGKFPYTVLMDANGKQVHAWEGLPAEGAEKFTSTLKQICDASKN